jgi:hypothetical protein
MPCRELTRVRNREVQDITSLDMIWTSPLLSPPLLLPLLLPLPPPLLLPLLLPLPLPPPLLLPLPLVDPPPMCGRGWFRTTGAAAGRRCTGQRRPRSHQLPPPLVLPPPPPGLPLPVLEALEALLRT